MLKGCEALSLIYFPLMSKNSFLCNEYTCTHNYITLRIFISLLNKFWDLAKFFLVILLMATTWLGLCNQFWMLVCYTKLYSFTIIKKEDSKADGSPRIFLYIRVIHIHDIFHIQYLLFHININIVCTISISCQF